MNHPATTRCTAASETHGTLISSRRLLVRFRRCGRERFGRRRFGVGYWRFTAYSRALLRCYRMEAKLRRRVGRGFDTTRTDARHYRPSGAQCVRYGRPCTLLFEPRQAATSARSSWQAMCSILQKHRLAKRAGMGSMRSPVAESRSSLATRLRPSKRSTVTFSRSCRQRRHACIEGS